MIKTESLLHKYNIAPEVTGFTTKRTLGRDRTRICELLGIDEDHLIVPHQTHGTAICPITSEILLLCDEERTAILEGIDAVVTDKSGVCIGVSTADCIPVLLFDIINKVVAAIHAGWKGTVQRIVQKTITLMEKMYATDAHNIIAVIGPGITLKNFEVGDEVYERFADAGFDMQSISEKFPVMNATANSPREKWHIDLHLCNKMQLMEMGVDEKNITVENICTYDNTDLFFSARVEQKGEVKCGRNFNAIMIND